MRTLLLTLLAIAHAKYTYKVTVIDKPPTPVISVGLPVGSGHSNCTFTFNPAFILARPPQLNQSLIIVRASGCSEEYGGSGDHLLMAYCDETTAICGDVQPTRFPFESAAEVNTND